MPKSLPSQLGPSPVIIARALIKLEPANPNIGAINRQLSTLNQFGISMQYLEPNQYELESCILLSISLGGEFNQHTSICNKIEP